MKIMACSVLILIALAFAALTNQFDTTNVNAVPFGIMAADSDADLDETDYAPFSDDDAALFSVPHVGKSAGIHTSAQSIDSSTTWYNPLSVHRPG